MTAPKIRKTSLDTAPLQKLDRDLRLNGRECQKLSVRIFLANIDALSQCPPWESLSKMSSLSRAQCSFPHQDDMSPDIQVPVCVLWLSFRFDGPGPANVPRNKVSRYFWVPFYRVESEIMTDTDPKLAQPFWFVPSFFAQRHLHLKNTAHCLFCTQLSFDRDGQVNETIGLWLWYGQDGLIFRFSLLLIGVVRLQEGLVFWKCLNGFWICWKRCDLVEGNCVWSHVFDFAWRCES